jgi:hypothetical protein
MTTCRTQEELDHIEYVVDNRNVGVEVKKMIPGIERCRLNAFRKEHTLGHKYVKQYRTEQIVVPGCLEPQTVLRRVTKGFEAGRIVVAKEDIFSTIGEWHRQNGHMGQERTHVYCSKKYYNVTQEHVRIYCETCFTCMKKNPVT